jgi:hypothetical protein
MISPMLLELGFDSRLVPLAVAAIATFFLMSSLRRMQRKQAERAQNPPPIVPRASSQVGPLHRDLDDLLVELQELSRRISAEIDTRFVKLEAAMRDADRRIAVLHRLSRQAGQNAAQEDASGSAHDARHTVIYELADAGFSPIEIARDLGRTPGEVELILNLRKKTA